MLRFLAVVTDCGGPMNEIWVFPFLQVPVLCHDSEGTAGTNGVDSGHFAGWKDLHLCLQYKC